MSDQRHKRDLLQTNLDKYMEILEMSIEHPQLNNREIGERLDPKISHERVRMIKKKIGDRTVQDMINLKKLAIANRLEV